MALVSLEDVTYSSAAVDQEKSVLDIRNVIPDHTQHCGRIAQIAKNVHDIFPFREIPQNITVEDFDPDHHPILLAFYYALHIKRVSLFHWYVIYDFYSLWNRQS